MRRIVDRATQIDEKAKGSEVDLAKLREALAHWKKIKRETGDGGLTCFEGLRLLSGLGLKAGATALGGGRNG